jgi:esterase
MKLFYRKFGNGPALIILHGLFGSSDNWVTIAKNLADSFTVYLPDQRNHGQSPHSNIHDYDAMRDDLHELVTGLKLRKFFLAGHSMGGKTAISFALKWSEMLNGLMVADISPFVRGDIKNSAYNQHLTILNTMLSVDLNIISTREQAESAIAVNIPSGKVRGFILKNLKRDADNNFMWKINAQALLNNLDNIMKGIDRGTFQDQQISGFPVIFLKGADSDYLPKDDFRDILRIFPAAEFITVPGAGHWLHADNPDAVIANIRKLAADV